MRNSIFENRYRISINYDESIISDLTIIPINIDTLSTKIDKNYRYLPVNTDNESVEIQIRKTRYPETDIEYRCTDGLILINNTDKDKYKHTDIQL